MEDKELNSCIKSLCKALNYENEGDVYSTLDHIKKEETISLHLFRVYIGQNFPGAVAALASVRGKKIKDIINNPVKYNEVLSVLQHLDGIYKQAYAEHN